jgi:hypothetical protein
MFSRKEDFKDTDALAPLPIPDGRAGPLAPHMTQHDSSVRR